MYRRQLRNQTSTKLFLYVIPENTRRKKKREKERRERDPDDGNLWWVTINPRALVIQKGLSLVSPPISSTYQPISSNLVERTSFIRAFLESWRFICRSSLNIFYPGIVCIVWERDKSTWFISLIFSRPEIRFTMEIYIWCIVDSKFIETRC